MRLLSVQTTGPASRLGGDDRHLRHAPASGTRSVPDTVPEAVATALNQMFLWFIVAVILRRRFQFGVGSLLVLTLAVAV
jgi:hypothetical protein